MLTDFATKSIRRSLFPAADASITVTHALQCHDKVAMQNSWHSALSLSPTKLVEPIMRTLCALALTYSVVCSASCSADETVTPANSAANVTLTNIHELSPRISSGSGPATADDFAQLAASGVKTVVSVDGAKPLVELATQNGLQYVHIPIGYDGLSREAQLMLTRVARESEGPIYVHCHHGKHRGPAAAAIVCMAEGSADHARSAEILKLAGTSEKYRGLWRDVAGFAPPSPDETLPELVEVAEVTDFIQAMSQIDFAYDNLIILQSHQWQPPTTHPELSAADELTLLAEGFKEARRFAAGDDHYAAMKQQMAESQALAVRAQDALSKNNTSLAASCMAQLRTKCASCHEQHRDNAK